MSLICPVSVEAATRFASWLDASDSGTSRRRRVQDLVQDVESNIGQRADACPSSSSQGELKKPRNLPLEPSPGQHSSADDFDHDEDFELRLQPPRLSSVPPPPGLQYWSAIRFSDDDSALVRAPGSKPQQWPQDLQWNPDRFFDRGVNSYEGHEFTVSFKQQRAKCLVVHFPGTTCDAFPREFVKHLLEVHDCAIIEPDCQGVGPKKRKFKAPLPAASPFIFRSPSVGVVLHGLFNDPPRQCTLASISPTAGFPPVSPPCLSRRRCQNG